MIPGRRASACSSVAFAALLVAAGCSNSPLPLQKARPNLVVVLSDTHRADYVSPAYPGGDQITPNVQLLARDGVRFSRAYTPIPTSAPAYATLFTGREPLEHRVLFNGQTLGPELPVLAEMLKAEGYQTGAAVANLFCSSDYGFGRGFDSFWDEVPGRGKEGRHVTAAAIDFLEQRDRRRPFFLFLAYMDAHVPLVTESRMPSLLIELDGEPIALVQAESEHRLNRVPMTLAPGRHQVSLRFVDELRVAADGDAPSPMRLADIAFDDDRVVHRFVAGLAEAQGTPFRRMLNQSVLEVGNPTAGPLSTHLTFAASRDHVGAQHKAWYLEGVRAFDREMGRLLGQLKVDGLYDDSMIVFLSDHGEMLGEHGAWGHLSALYEEDVRVPLVVKGAGWPAGTESDRLLTLADVHRALVSVGGGGTGPGTLGPPGGAELALAAYPPAPEPRRFGLIRDHAKLIADDAFARVEIYDLRADPREQDDLFPSREGAAAARQMLGAVKGHRERATRVPALDLQSLAPDHLERLRSLGYAR